MTVITMSRTEIDRMSVLQDLAASRIKVAEASTLMGLGRRQLSANKPGSSELAARCQSRNALQLLECGT